MVRGARSARPKDELKRELHDQLGLMRLACESYDRGFEASAKHVALTLRVLLHHHKQSRALLEQLSLRSGRFADTAGKLNPRNSLTECNLVGYTMTSEGAQCQPCVQLGFEQLVNFVPFTEWWIDPVLKDVDGRFMSRFDLVMNVADTDGGAHVDPELDATYMAISRANSLGWNFTHSEGSVPPSGRPELACIRQIAHEVFLTVQQNSPEFKHLASPVIPPARGDQAGG